MGLVALGGRPEAPFLLGLNATPAHQTRSRSTAGRDSCRSRKLQVRLREVASHT